MKAAIRTRLKLRRQALFRDTAKCVFCRAAPTTHEHVYAKRWHKYLLPRTTARNGITIDIRYPTRIERAHFSTPPMRDWQPKCVCKDCNNGWMRALESRLDPLMSKLIQAEKASFSSTDVQDLAMWAIMKVMVVHHQATRATQRHWMRKEQKPPDAWWAVWIGTYDRTQWKSEFVSTPFRIDANFKFSHGRRPKGWPPNSIATTQIFKKLLIHTIYCPHPRLADGWRYTPPRVRALSGNFIKIWPPTGIGLRAWPQAALTDADAMTVAYGLLATLMRWAEVNGLAMPLSRPS